MDQIGLLGALEDPEITSLNRKEYIRNKMAHTPKPIRKAVKKHEKNLRKQVKESKEKAKESIGMDEYSKVKRKAKSHAAHKGRMAIHRKYPQMKD